MLFNKKKQEQYGERRETDTEKEKATRFLCTAPSPETVQRSSRFYAATSLDPADRKSNLFVSVLD